MPVLGPDEEPVSPAYESLYVRSADRHVRGADLHARGADLHVRGAVPGAPVNLRTLSRLLEYSLALSAWKQAGGTRWALRVNPSSCCWGLAGLRTIALGGIVTRAMAYLQDAGVCPLGTKRGCD